VGDRGGGGLDAGSRESNVSGIISSIDIVHCTVCRAGVKRELHYPPNWKQTWGKQGGNITYFLRIAVHYVATQYNVKRSYNIYIYNA
jgi:hypothetical protein